MSTTRAGKRITNGNVCGSLSTCEDKNIEKIHRIATSQGLTSNYIMKLISIIESEENSVKYKLKVMECLIPQDKIAEEAFIRMTCILSSLKFSVKLNVKILQWIIAVHSFMETSDKFQLLYEIFFRLLEYETLRPYVCHLLYVITQKEQVTTKRINHVFKLFEKYGKQPCLILLLHSYFMLSPEFFSGELDEDLEYDFESLGNYPTLIKSVHPSYEPYISSVHISTREISRSTDVLSESGTLSEKSCDSLSLRLGSFQETYQEFKTLEKSTNISKILKSRLRRLFLTSDLPLKTEIKLHDYILTSFYQNLDSSEFLEKNLEIFHEMQKCIPGVSDFTEALVSAQNNNSDLLAGVISEILYYEPISCFEKVGHKMDLIREQLLSSSAIPVKCQLLNCFSRIYLNWILMEFDDSADASVSCDGNCPNSSRNRSSNIQNHSPVNQIYELGSYIHLICNALLIDDSHPCLLNEVLLHYERVSVAHMKANKNLIIHFPLEPVIYLALFSLSGITLDNLSRLMLRFNSEIVHMQEKGNNEADLAAKCFNVCSLDFQKLLLGFNEEVGDSYLSKTAVFKRLKEKYPKFKNLFLLHKHPALFLKAMDFGHKKISGNLHSNSDARLNFLHYLDRTGYKHLKYLATLYLKMSSANIIC